MVGTIDEALEKAATLTPALRGVLTGEGTEGEEGALGDVGDVGEAATGADVPSSSDEADETVPHEAA